MNQNSASGPCAARRSRRVSMVYVGPARSMSTRLTENRGSAEVAITVIRYRSSAADTARSVFCHGAPVGTNTTSSRSKRSATSLAATKCPWWMGSNVPPMTPTRVPPMACSGSAVPVEGHGDQQQGDERAAHQDADQVRLVVMQVRLVLGENLVEGDGGGRDHAASGSRWWAGRTP